MIFGFPKIYDVCKSGVKPIINKEANGDFDMGTCFKITGNAIVTARHCVENKNHISIPGWDPLKCRLLNIFVHKDRSIDVAVLLFESNPLLNAHSFTYPHQSRVLDKVITMGYPPISGFDSLLVAETGEVAAIIKATTGTIVAADTSYLDKQDYILINTRIKGGNSGGPVIESSGYLIGIVTSAPDDADGVDHLGYGLAISSDKIHDLLSDVEQRGELMFDHKDDGFSTQKL